MDNEELFIKAWDNMAQLLDIPTTTPACFRCSDTGTTATLTNKKAFYSILPRKVL